MLLDQAVLWAATFSLGFTENAIVNGQQIVKLEIY